MAQAVAEGAVQVGPVAQRVHLVDAHAVEVPAAAASIASSSGPGSPLASGTMISVPGPMCSSTSAGWFGAVVGAVYMPPP